MDTPRTNSARRREFQAATGMGTPAWMRLTLQAAAVYNVLWGAWSILFPSHFWSLLNMEQPSYPFLWQCIGMIVGVYGVGYWFAATDPARHWPIVLVGFLGKIFGPIGFLDAHFVQQLVPLRFGVTLLTNDLIWWVPFALILRHAYRVNTAAREAALTERARSGSGDGPGRDGGAADEGSLATAMAAAKTARGSSLAELSAGRPVLVVFLRHLGCTFCREALADLLVQRPVIERTGAVICLVHMSSDTVAAEHFRKYGLESAERISDPERKLYGVFELARGSLSQLFGPRVWVRGFVAGVLDRHGVGGLRGDGLQMPGAFLIRDGRVVHAYRHRDAADRPDYCRLASI